MVATRVMSVYCTPGSLMLRRAWWPRGWCVYCIPGSLMLRRAWWPLGWWVYTVYLVVWCDREHGGHEGDADGEEEGHQDHYQPLRPLTRLHLRLLLQGEKNTVMPLCELKTKHKKCWKDCGKIMIREKNLSWWKIERGKYWPGGNIDQRETLIHVKGRNIDQREMLIHVKGRNIDQREMLIRVKGRNIDQREMLIHV